MTRGQDGAFVKLMPIFGAGTQNRIILNKNNAAIGDLLATTSHLIARERVADPGNDAIPLAFLSLWIVY
jgi:hypothetical protein